MQRTSSIAFEASPGPIAAPPAGRTDLWFVDLRLPAETLAGLSRFLTPDEVERAGRFHFQVHRDRYVARRGALRWLLGRYLDRDPSVVQLAYGDHEKPRLAGEAARCLQFNLSDSEDFALIGFDQGNEIGVDIEVVRDMPDAESIAHHFFSSGERRDLSRLPRGERQSLGFFHCWTRKEAYLKAIGKGLAAPLDAFRVTLHPDDPPRFLSFDGQSDEPEHWSLLHLEPAPGVVGALAVRRPGLEARGHRWTPEALFG